MKPFWVDEVERTIHSLDWWRDLWSKAEGIEIVDMRGNELLQTGMG
jgi:hypothetical protein